MWPPLLMLGLLLGLAASTGGQEFPLAPDGRRGLGGQSPLQELRNVVQSRVPADEAFLAGLRDLESELTALAATAEVLYHRRHYFELLPWRDPTDLAHLASLLSTLSADPGTALVRRDGSTRLAARLLLDVRLRVRFLVLEERESDAATVARGLLVLRAESQGLSRLDQAEASNLAARVDLAAASLRARILDLRALHEDLAGPGEVDEAELDQLLELCALPPGPPRGYELARIERQVEERVTRMHSLLFTTRLREQAAREFSWRDEEDRQAAEALAEVLLLRPDTETGARAPEEIERRGKTTRRRQAMQRAFEGLLHDPLDPDLTYSAGITAEYVRGRLETLSLYDRFLALRGIRPDDDRNWRSRRLTEEESHALFYIQVIAGPTGG